MRSRSCAGIISEYVAIDAIGNGKIGKFRCLVSFTFLVPLNLVLDVLDELVALGEFLIFDFRVEVV